MLIHHYTNIESLALILKSKKIRFNRLDRMDDLEEGRVEAQGIPVAKYTYVSCWTEDDEESVPLWKMYAGNGGGVRISLPQDMFRDYNLLDELVDNQDLSEKILGYVPNVTPSTTLKIPEYEYFGKNYFILPVHSHDLRTFYGQIFYTEDICVQSKDVCNITHKDNGTYDLELNWNKVGTFKHSRWSFQKESRFILRIFPTECELTLFDASHFMEHLVKALSIGLPPHFETYDLTLKDNIFNELEVTLSPSIKVGQRVIVEALLNQYAPKAKIKESSLTQLVQMK